MSTPPTFDHDPYRRELTVEVRACDVDDGGVFATADDTVLYPGGGGQPEDHGWLDGVRVTGVSVTDAGIRHRLESPVATGPARLELDWARRYDHMQQHTAQHLLSAVAADRFGWETTAFHLGTERSDIELDVASLAARELEALEDAVAELVREARPVRVRRVSLDEYRSLDVRSRGLPAGHRGSVRLVEIEGVDRASCGGTHLASTAEIEALKLLGTESMRGGTRLHWVAGARVRSRLGRHEQRTESLRRLFGTPDDELVDAAAWRLEQLKAAERQLRFVESELAQETADRLLRSPDAVVDAHFDGMGAAFLRAVAQAFAAGAGERCALLTASSDDGDFFAVVVGPEAAVDLAAVGGAVAELLEGRGGGRAPLYQGKAGSLSRRDEALERLAAHS